MASARAANARTTASTPSAASPSSPKSNFTTHTDLPLWPVDDAGSVVESVRVEIALLMLLTLYLAGFLVFVSIGLLIARAGCRLLRHMTSATPPLAPSLR